ncbi:MAG: RES domain-containing protein [Lachnospiraceae bacterium]|nr:RES domain-containing protein [Lachnospiraceae bacterium]
MRYCCEKCFSNKYLKEYILSENKGGKCDYCNSNGVNIISTEKIGAYIRECLKKAYEDIENGTGAYWDSEEKQYCNRTGRMADPYSIRDILVEEENVLNEAVIDTTILEDIFSDSGLSFEEKKQGELDVFEDIDNCNLVLKDDLYGLEATKMYYTWEFFKYITKYYNRFFDIDKDCQRRHYLKELVPYLLEYETVIKEGTIYYRARKLNEEKLYDLENKDVYKEMAPAPPKYATTNRMSPAGISYLYVASDRETAYKECRYKDAMVMVAEYVLKEELTIIDFSQVAFVTTKSIFSKEYDHDLRWINNFLDSFIKEITSPVDDKKEDHSYEYVATQVIAEYIRSLGYDGICFNSSVARGKSYVFFCGPNMEYSSDGYDYIDEYLWDTYPKLTYFTDWFDIQKLEYNYVFQDGIKYQEKKKIFLKKSNYD